MLLSIDRVLQLLGEGKTLEKIADMAQCNTDDVASIIEEARNIITKYEKPRGRKKIIIRKDDDISNDPENGELDDKTKQIFYGAELSTIPYGSELTMYTDGASKGNPGPSGIGIVIFDKEDRQVGKVSAYIGNTTNNAAEYLALIRALKIAVYFKTELLKIRTDSELIVKQISGEYQVRNKNIKKFYDEVQGLLKSVPQYRIEHVSRNLNDKADYLAKKACS